MGSALRTSERLWVPRLFGVHQTGLGERALARDLSEPRLAANPVHDVAASPVVPCGLLPTGSIGASVSSVAAAGPPLRSGLPRHSAVLGTVPEPSAPKVDGSLYAEARWCLRDR